MPPGQTVCPAFRRWERAEDLFRTRQYAVGAFAVYPAGDSGRFPANINDKKKRVTDISVTLILRTGAEGGTRTRTAIATIADWCRGRDSNPHSYCHYPLKIACLPVPPPRRRRELLTFFRAAGKSFFLSGCGRGWGRASRRETCGQRTACISPFFIFPVKARWGKDGGLEGRGTPPAPPFGRSLPPAAFPPRPPFPRPHGAAGRTGLALALAYAYINAT